METGNIQKVSSNLSYEMKKFSASVKSGYGNSGDSRTVESDTSFNLMMSSFKVQVSSNTYENINSQGGFLERLSISSASSLSASSSESSTLFSSSPSSTSSGRSSSEQADALFGEDGYWGVNKTASRISDFVLSGAGDDIEKLKAGREGVLRGLKAAEKVWGGKMPDIAYQTIDKSLEAIDEKINELGGNVLDVSV